MIFAEADDRPVGERVTMKSGKMRRVEIEGEVVSEQPISVIEIIVNGRVTHRLEPKARVNRDNAKEVKFRQVVQLGGSSWVAVRCWEPRAGGRMRFAHTAPWFFDVPDAPLRPRREEVELLIRPVREEIERSASVLPEEAMAEYRKALGIYEEIARRAR
jgi:hypothetical protein